MRCEFLLILYPICWLHLPSLVRPKVLRRLRKEWRGTGRERKSTCPSLRWKRESARRKEGENEGTWLSEVTEKGNEQRPTLTWFNLYLVPGSLKWEQERRFCRNSHLCEIKVETITVLAEVIVAFTNK